MLTMDMSVKRFNHLEDSDPSTPSDTSSTSQLNVDSEKPHESMDSNIEKDSESD